MNRDVLVFLFAGSLVVSEEVVLRDQFYNGNMKKERGAVNVFFNEPFRNILHRRGFHVCVLWSSGAVVLRLARSWFRIGSLEVLTRSGELDLLRSGGCELAVRSKVHNVLTCLGITYFCSLSTGNYCIS